MAANFDSVIRKPEIRSALNDSIARIDLERQGMPVNIAEALRKQMGLSVEEFSRTLGFKPGTYRKKVADKKPLSGRDGDAIVDLCEMLAIVRDLLPAERVDFNIPRWFTRWIAVPQPSLRGYKPEEILDTPTGRRLVKRLVGALESGVYL